MNVSSTIFPPQLQNTELGNHTASQQPLSEDNRKFDESELNNFMEKLSGAQRPDHSYKEMIMENLLELLPASSKKILLETNQNVKYNNLALALINIDRTHPSGQLGYCFEAHNYTLSEGADKKEQAESVYSKLATNKEELWLYTLDDVQQLSKNTYEIMQYYVRNNFDQNAQEDIITALMTFRSQVFNQVSLNKLPQDLLNNQQISTAEFLLESFFPEKNLFSETWSQFLNEENDINKVFCYEDSNIKTVLKNNAQLNDHIINSILPSLKSPISDMSDSALAVIYLSLAKHYHCTENPPLHIPKKIVEGTLSSGTFSSIEKIKLYIKAVHVKRLASQLIEQGTPHARALAEAFDKSNQAFIQLPHKDRNEANLKKAAQQLCKESTSLPKNLNAFV